MARVVLSMGLESVDEWRCRSVMRGSVCRHRGRQLSFSGIERLERESTTSRCACNFFKENCLAPASKAGRSLPSYYAAHPFPICAFSAGISWLPAPIPTIQMAPTTPAAAGDHSAARQCTGAAALVRKTIAVMQAKTTTVVRYACSKMPRHILLLLSL